MSKKGKYTIKKIVKNCILPEGLYELKDKETKFYLILEDKANVEKLEDYLIDKDRKIADLQSQLDQANEKLKGAGVTKFELGQEVFVFDWEEQIRSGRIYEIQINAVLHDRQPHITYLVDFTGNYNDDDQENDYYEEKDIYATEEEINIKLQELRG